MNKYIKMTNEEFDEILAEVVKENAATLLQIPDAYDVFSEHYNNEVLDRWHDRHAAPEDEDDTAELKDLVFGDGE